MVVRLSVSHPAVSYSLLQEKNYILYIGHFPVTLLQLSAWRRVAITASRRPRPTTACLTNRAAPIDTTFLWYNIALALIPACVNAALMPWRRRQKRLTLTYDMIWPLASVQNFNWFSSLYCFIEQMRQLCWSVYTYIYIYKYLCMYPH